MIDDESAADRPDVRREIDEDGDQRAKLDHCDSCRRLLRTQRRRGLPVKSQRAARENEVRGRANRNELRQALHNTNDDRLQNRHEMDFRFLIDRVFRFLICDSESQSQI